MKQNIRKRNGCHMEDMRIGKHIVGKKYWISSGDINA